MSTIFSLSILVGCGSIPLAKIAVPENLQSQPEWILTTNGDFWGLGRKGTFDLEGKYSGSYNRSINESSWFGSFIETKKGGMGAEIINNATQTKWQLSCYGGGTSVNLGSFAIGGDDDSYQCDIYRKKAKIGKFKLEGDTSLISLGSEKKVTGKITIGKKSFKVASVHKAVTSSIPVENPLGYYISKNGQTIAAIQTNGLISMRQLASTNRVEQDILVTALIASALSWRP